LYGSVYFTGDILNSDGNTSAGASLFMPAVEDQIRSRGMTQYKKRSLFQENTHTVLLVVV